MVYNGPVVVVADSRSWAEAERPMQAWLAQGWPDLASQSGAGEGNPRLQCNHRASASSCEHMGAHKAFQCLLSKGCNIRAAENIHAPFARQAHQSAAPTCKSLTKDNPHACCSNHSNVMGTLGTQCMALFVYSTYNSLNQNRVSWIGSNHQPHCACICMLRTLSCITVHFSSSYISIHHHGKTWGMRKQSTTLSAHLSDAPEIFYTEQHSCTDRLTSLFLPKRTSH